MVDPNNFRMVINSIKEMVNNEGKDMKGSLKLSLGYLLKKAARFTKSEFISLLMITTLKLRREICFWRCLIVLGPTFLTTLKYNRI